MTAAANAANICRFSGFADTYDAHRPTPPAAIVDFLIQLTHAPRPALVVDLGSGTGLSTRIWAGRADRVVGIEPNPDMRRHAETQPAPAAPVEYRDGTSTATGVPDASADIVTISQALHWMEPGPTFAEVARILRPGGVLAAYDCDWPPTITPGLHAAYVDFDRRCRQLERDRTCSPDVRQYDKHEHLARMRTSGHFRHAWETVFHGVETGDAVRLVRLALSQGGAQACVRAGLTSDEIGLADLEATAQREMAGRDLPWYFSYRVRIAVK